MNSDGVPFAGCFLSDPNEADSRQLVFVGLPDDSQSSYRHGAGRAPAQIRAAYDGRCYNSASERGPDLAARVADMGDVAPGADWIETRRRFREVAARIFAERRIPFFAGGDHAVTVPVAEALSELGEPIHVVQLDAHPDLYPEYMGNPHSHACTAARLLEMPHVASLTQIGVRTFEETQRRTASKNPGRLQVMEARGLRGRDIPLTLPSREAVYLTLDMDVLDPAFAPGVSHPVPGGLNPGQLLNWLLELDCRLVGMDVVEVNPELDRGHQTAILAGRLLHEGMALAAAQVAQN